MTRKFSVIALEMPARVQPVASDIGWRKIASENIAPIPTQVISAPAAMMTQRYDEVTCSSDMKASWPSCAVCHKDAGRAHNPTCLCDILHGSRHSHRPTEQVNSQRAGIGA